MAQVNIRMSGEIFVHALKRTGKRMSVSEIMKLRRSMYKEISSMGLEKISSLCKKIITGHIYDDEKSEVVGDSTSDLLRSHQLAAEGAHQG